MSANDSKSAKVRAKLNHPIIDTDGHTVEFTPVFFDYIKEVGGAGMIERYKKAVGSRSNNRWMELSEEERRYTRVTCPPWWARPAKNTTDRATASLPHLLYQRMDLLRLRGRRSLGRVGVQFESESHGREAQSDDELGHRTLGCDRHERGGRGGS